MLVHSLYQGAIKQGLDSKIASKGTSPDNVLVMYGMGGPDRLHIANKHVEAGGRLITWDAGYWERQLSDGERKYRVAFDGMHSPYLVMKGGTPSEERWAQSRIKMLSSGSPDGHIMLVGNGPKSNAVVSQGWSQAKAQEIRETFPNKKIIYRPKPRRPPERGIDCDMVSSGAIESALADASLVVCRHSNVAVDACIAGVPVVCEDGAAACIYPNRLEDYKNQPDFKTRIEFLHRLAYWQWSTSECSKGIVWPWLIKVLNGKV